MRPNLAINPSSEPAISPMVNPKIIHRIYFTDVPPYRDKYAHFLATWKREMPDYKIMQWNEHNLDLQANEWVRRAARSKQPVFLAEYFRWKMLQEYGGLYLDADCEVLSGRTLGRLLDELWASDQFDAFFGVEEFNNGFPTAQTVAAKKGSALVDFMVNMYETALSGPLWHWKEERSLIGPQLISLYFRERGREKDYGMFKYITAPEVEARVKVYPQEWFSPKFGISGRTIKYTDNTCVYHMFSNDNVVNMSYEGRQIRDRPLLFHEYLEFIKQQPSFWTRAQRFMSSPNRVRRLKRKLLGS
jgi:hypothetical protein